MTGKEYLSLIEEITHIASYYSVAKETLLIKNSTFESGLPDSFNPYIRYVDRVNYAFLKLENIYKEIITNEFFCPGDTYWWTPRYTQAIFVKHKAKAMKSFVRYFNEKN